RPEVVVDSTHDVAIAGGGHNEDSRFTGRCNCGLQSGVQSAANSPAIVADLNIGAPHRALVAWWAAYDRAAVVLFHQRHVVERGDRVRVAPLIVLIEEFERQKPRSPFHAGYASAIVSR